MARFSQYPAASSTDYTDAATFLILAPDGTVKQATLEGLNDNYFGGIRFATVTIPTAEVLTLNSVPKAFGLTVPTGYHVEILGASATIQYGSAAYATNTQLQLTNGGAAALGTIGNNFLASTVSKTTTSYSPTNPTAGQTQVLTATDVFVTNTTGEPITGDSNIAVGITYRIVID
jgi:hypothetical protein